MVNAPLTALTDPRSPAVEWTVSEGVVPYLEALSRMEARVAAIADGAAPEQIWLLQHPSLYTAGTSARDEDLLHAGAPVFRTGRGGQFTWHGPGQRVAYVMLDLKRRGPDVRLLVQRLEAWLIATLAEVGVAAHAGPGRIGVWVDRPDKGPGYEDKIAAIGIRVRRWVSFHGVSLNVAPDLAPFAGIVPCGISDARYGVTSLADLGSTATMADLDRALRRTFERVFSA